LNSSRTIISKPKTMGRTTISHRKKKIGEANTTERTEKQNQNGI